MRPKDHPRKLRRASVDSFHSARISKTTDGSNDLKRPISAYARSRLRELSGIREVSNPDSNAGEPERRKSTSQVNPVDAPTIHNHVPPPFHPRAASTISLPLSDVPDRRSSRRLQRQKSEFYTTQEFPSLGMPPPRGSGQTIPTRGRSISPVRNVADRDAVTSDAARRMPSRTFIRTVKLTDILQFPTLTHARIEMKLQIVSPLFVGGGTIEGKVHITVDKGVVKKKTQAKPIHVSRVSVDLVGVEEVWDGKRWIFLSLASELFDEDHPPPSALVTSQTPASSTNLSWEMKPSAVGVPFCLNLPLNMGPPPYHSKNARIRYILCSTTVINIGEKQHIVRHSEDIFVLTVHDPEKALGSLRSPLLVSEELRIPNGAESQSVKLTAGLHRQTWVNGATAFIDVHIANCTANTIKRLEVQLEKTVLHYAHAAASTAESNASHLRLPNRTEREILSKTSFKKGKAWDGVRPNSSEVRTCEIGVPRGHVTISTGRYFEVRFFLNVRINVSLFRAIQVQLPVTVIHINSLDIVPNSIAQVAAAIESKRNSYLRDESQPVSPFFQGQAFTAPRRQSISIPDFCMSGAISANQVTSLTREVDESPRRLGRHGSKMQKHRVSTNASKRLGGEDNRVSMENQDPVHCHCRHRSSLSSIGPYKLPRIQVSTSGLGFSEEELEHHPDIPRNNRESKEARQQMELSLARKRSKKEMSKGPWGWRNAAEEASRREV